jgi:hypothetical protein
VNVERFFPRVDVPSLIRTSSFLIIPALTRRKTKMTKTELLAILEQYEDEDEFLLSSDEEGNSYRTADLGEPEMAYFDGDEWNVMHPDDIEAGEYDEEILTTARRVGVFW